ncbi:TPA: hypothetical protein ACP9DH_002886 [Legionella anisa]
MPKLFAYPWKKNDVMVLDNIIDYAWKGSIQGSTTNFNCFNHLKLTVMSTKQLFLIN